MVLGWLSRELTPILRITVDGLVRGSMVVRSLLKWIGFAPEYAWISTEFFGESTFPILERLLSPRIITFEAQAGSSHDVFFHAS